MTPATQFVVVYLVDGSQRWTGLPTQAALDQWLIDNKGVSAVVLTSVQTIRVQDRP